jgi:hypothetical protein
MSVSLRTREDSQIAKERIRDKRRRPMARQKDCKRQYDDVGSIMEDLARRRDKNQVKNTFFTPARPEVSDDYDPIIVCGSEFTIRN